MSTQFLLRQRIAAVFFVALLSVSVSQRAIRSDVIPDITGSRTATPQKQKDECKPWQQKDKNDNCVDKPGAIHHGVDYAPSPGETCWVECLCREGLYPQGNSCSPCSKVGVVCIP